MARTFSLFLAIIVLSFSQEGFPSDFYAMGCKPSEPPERVVSKPAEKALPPARKPQQEQPRLIEEKADKNALNKKIARKELKRINHHKIRSHHLRQVAAFRVRKNAVNLVRKLEKDGHKAVMRKGVTKDKIRIYRVFVLKPEKAKEETLKRKPGHKLRARRKLSIEKKPVLHEKVPEGHRELPEQILFPGKPGYESVAEKKPVEEPAPGDKVVAVGGKVGPQTVQQPEYTNREIPPVKRSVEEAPAGVTRNRLSGDVFGKGGFLHPFLAVTEYFTDNVFFTRDNKKSDFATIISPGIWLTVPHVYEKLLHIDTSSLSPGGFSLGRYRPESFRRYQAYLLYNADIERYAKYSSENAVNHRAEGLFQYNLRGGLSVDLLDRFVSSHDVRGTNITTTLDKFRSNLAGATLVYDAGYRFKFRMDYSNFLLHYNSNTNDFRDRDDNAVSGYFYYKFRPKTYFFAEYEFVDVRYKTNTMTDSTEHHFFGGIQWDITAKSKGTVKAGYGIKDFADSALANNNDFILEAQIDHKLTAKTSLILKASRMTNETNVLTTDYMVSNAFGLEYLQRFTGKITADAQFSFINDNYKGNFTSGGITKKLRNYYYKAAFALRYKYKEWLQMDLGYVFDLRDSSFSEFNYTNNSVFVRLTGTL